MLSARHQERARPNIQKALLTLQNASRNTYEQQNEFTSVEQSILDMLFSQSSEPSVELIDVAAKETGISSDRIRVWLDLKKKGDEKSDQSDSFSKDADFSDDNSNQGDKLKIDEGPGLVDGLKIEENSVKSELKLSDKIELKKESSDNEQSNRRMRTLISPDQAEVLYREYLEVVYYFIFSFLKFFFKDNCPPRQRLEEIAAQTGLKRRVVQVWFQNTRARERKGQYRSVSMFAQKQQSQQVSLQAPSPVVSRPPSIQNQPKNLQALPASLLMLTENLKAKEGKCPLKHQRVFKLLFDVLYYTELLH